MGLPGQQLRDAALAPIFRALNAVVVPTVKAGIGSPCALGSGIVVLETTGRVSGEKREVPLLGARLGDRVLVSTVRGNSQWAKNAEADPAVAVWVDGEKRPASAEVHLGPLTLASLRLSEGDAAADGDAA